MRNRLLVYTAASDYNNSVYVSKVFRMKRVNMEYN